MGKPHLTAEHRAMAHRLHAKGLNFTEIGRQLDCSLQTAWNVINRRPTRIVRPFSWSPAPGRLTLPEREEISLALRRGDTITIIATSLGRAIRSELERRSPGLSGLASSRERFSSKPSPEGAKTFVTGAR
jgi:IS30 family transposase